MALNHEEISLLNCGKVPTLSPQKASQDAGQMQALKNFVKKQKKSKGFSLSVASGQINNFDIKISGSAQFLLGFALISSVGPQSTIVGDDFTLTVNNEIIVEAVNPNFFGYALTDNDYYYFPRPLYGSDTVTVNVVASSSGIIEMIVYYIEK